MAVWYANIPEETTRFKTPYMGQYMMFAYLFAISFILFIILGVMYMVSHPVKKYVLYSLTAILIFSSYYVWLYSVTIKGWHINPFLQFGNLVLFAAAVFKLNK